MTSTEIGRNPWKLLDYKLHRTEDNIKDYRRDKKNQLLNVVEKVQLVF